MLRRFLVLLATSCLVVVAEEPVTCSKNYTLLETQGDAVLSVFVDANRGTFCNETTVKGLEQISTILYVIQTLNNFDYVPGITLGVKIVDTCHDETTVYKRALQSAVDLDCTDRYELGVLAPSAYAPLLEPLKSFNDLPIALYEDQNLTTPLINVLAHYLSTRFETVDLVLSSTEFALDGFLEATREAGVCVGSYGILADVNGSQPEAVIAVLGGEREIGKWVEAGERNDGHRKTWVLLPIDGSRVDDLLPPGSYAISPEPLALDSPQDVPSILSSANLNSAIRSPHLLGVGKSLVELAQVLRELHERSCPRESRCAMPRFDPRSRHQLRNSDVYEALRVLPKSHSIRYVVSTRSQQELVEVASYRLEASRFKVVPEKRLPRMPRLCVKRLAGNCERCANFQRKPRRRGRGEGSFLKPGNWAPTFLTIACCGCLACAVILAFIVHRFLAEDSLDGNPALTIVLIVSNVFVLFTVVPFCVDDDFFGAESLNSRKIFLTTLAFGMVFSVMLSRALFLAFSDSGLIVGHVNGYLQGFMVLFVAGVQVSVSTMYLVLAGTDSAVVVRSMRFVALLGYDIFLLLLLFAVCCFAGHVQRNYREGKCFFGTSIGLLIAWAVWITCFVLTEPETRDLVVSFGIVSTSYLIIVGTLVPRTYYMATHVAREKRLARRYDLGDLGRDPRSNALARQSRAFYDYVHPPIGSSASNLHGQVSCPNYYGSPCPNSRFFNRCTSPDPRRTPGYSNYGFHSEMRELDNSYVVPRVCIENTDGHRNEMVGGYARPQGQRKVTMTPEDRECVETNVYVEERLSPSRRGRDESYPSRCHSPRVERTEDTIREEDEADDITRITRF